MPGLIGGKVGRGESWGRGATSLLVRTRTMQGLSIEEEEDEEVWRGLISVCSIKSMCLGAEAPD